jgi:hypothetical protein
MASKSCRLHFLFAEEEGGREREEERPGAIFGLVMGEARGELASSYTRTALSEGQAAVSVMLALPNTTSMLRALLGDARQGDSTASPILPPCTGIGWMAMIGAG